MNEPQNANEIQDERARKIKETGHAEDERPESWRQRWRPALIVAASTLAIILVVWLVWRSRKSTETSATEATPIVSVQVAKAERQPIAAQVSAVGTVFPREQATVSAKISAQLKQMSLLKNKIVRAGEVIAVLESRDLLAQRNEAVAALSEASANQRSVVTGTIPQTIAQDEKALRVARANVANARATYERRRVLYERGGISKKELEASQLALTTAEDDLRLAEQTVALRAKSLNPNDRALAAARVEQAQQHVGTLDAQLSYATIRAPITGMVTDQFQFAGEFAAAGAKLVNIADISQVIVKAPFSDTVAAQLKVGDAATVLPTAIPDERMNGQVSLISHATDPTNRTVDVWVTLANEAGRLRANDAAQVIVTSQSKSDAIVVPASAVTLDSPAANTGTVMVVDANSTAHKRKVTVGIQTKEKTEIASGLQEGEVVVTQGNYELPDGTKVQVENSNGSRSSSTQGGGAGETNNANSSATNSNASHQGSSNLNGASPGSIEGQSNSGNQATNQGTTGGSNQDKTNPAANPGQANSGTTQQNIPSSSQTKQGSSSPGASNPGTSSAGTNPKGSSPGSSNPSTTTPVTPGGASKGAPAPGGAKP